AVMSLIAPTDPCTRETLRERGTLRLRGLRLRVTIAARSSLPLFVEEAGVDDLSGPARAGRSAEVDDRVVGKLGDLQRIRAVSFAAEIDAAVQHDVVARVERVRINENRHVVGGIVALAVKHELLLVPFHRQAVDNLRDDIIRSRIAPE